MKTVLPFVVTVLASLCARRVLSLPTGAPVAACDTLTPNPIGHRGPTQNSTVPYAIDLDPFRTQADNESLQYTPGKTYTLDLSGNNFEQFRGFFIQARLVADDRTRVGTFDVTGPNSRLSNCSPASAGITHTDRSDKRSVTFRWTAPPKGTGAIRFAFAVVQVLDTYWADRRVDMVVAEGDSGAMKLASTGFLMILVIALVVALKDAF